MAALSWFLCSGVNRRRDEPSRAWRWQRPTAEDSSPALASSPSARAPVWWLWRLLKTRRPVSFSVVDVEASLDFLRRQPLTENLGFLLCAATSAGCSDYRRGGRVRLNKVVLHQIKPFQLIVRNDCMIAPFYHGPVEESEECSAPHAEAERSPARQSAAGRMARTLLSHLMSNDLVKADRQKNQ